MAKYRYFTGNVDFWGEKLAAASEAVDRAQEARTALAETFGAVACTMTNGLGTGTAKVTGFCFLERGAQTGLKFARTAREDGETYYCYTPDRRYKAGKEIASKIESVNKAGHVTFSGHLLADLPREMNKRVFDGCYMLSSAAGKANGVAVFRIPVAPDDEPFTAPCHLVEVKKSEFIALTEEGS